MVFLWFSSIFWNAVIPIDQLLSYPIRSCSISCTSGRKASIPRSTWMMLDGFMMLSDGRSLNLLDFYSDFNFTWLVVSTPLKNISRLGWWFRVYGKNNNVPNHQPVTMILTLLFYYYIIAFYWCFLDFTMILLDFNEHTWWNKGDSINTHGDT